MEYNKFIRLYYLEMLKIFEHKEFKPSIIQESLIEEEGTEIPIRNMKIGDDQGFLGLYKLELDAPNNVYENYFEKMSSLYPEFGMLFLNREMLIGTSKKLDTVEDIDDYLKTILFVYEQMDLVSSEE